MASSYKGKFFLHNLLLVLCFSHISWVLADSDSVVTEIESKHVNEYKPEINDALDVLNRHQVQLEKLEELVKNLSELLSRLESQFSEYSKVGSLIDKEHDTVDEKLEFDRRKDDGERLVEKIENDNIHGDVKDGRRVGAVPVTKFSPFWSERFQFVSAVKLGSNPTCINVLPFRDFEGLSKYVAVGDDLGRVYVLFRNGDSSEFYTLPQSPVTAMVSYLSVYKNESIVVTGHENGAILMHRVWEDSNGDEWNSLRMENIVKFDTPKLGDGLSPITILEVHHIGRKRYILSTDMSGKIRVFRENGTVYGPSVPVLSGRPLAFLKQRLLFLTETGAGSLDLRTMKIRESACEGLNNTVVKTYVFDATERSKAYGFTSEGDLIHVLLLGDIMNFKCRIRSKRKFDGGALSFQAIKGYLLIANEEKLFVYNVSQHYVRAGAPKLLFSTDLTGITTSFLNQQQISTNDKRSFARPVVASDHERLVILSLGNGYVGMYRSNLPVFKNEFNAMQWTSPVLFFLLFLFGAWHFFANKKEALTSWGPDDPFSTTTTSATNGAPLGSGSGDRSFTDSSRNDDVIDLRGSAMRGPSRRYASPSGYPGGSGNSYRPPSADASSLSASVDPNFRPTQELKFRGSNLETTGFPKRRDSLYANSQVVDDST